MHHSLSQTQVFVMSLTLFATPSIANAYPCIQRPTWIATAATTCTDLINPPVVLPSSGCTPGGVPYLNRILGHEDLADLRNRLEELSKIFPPKNPLIVDQILSEYRSNSLFGGEHLAFTSWGSYALRTIDDQLSELSKAGLDTKAREWHSALIHEAVEKWVGSMEYAYRDVEKTANFILSDLGQKELPGNPQFVELKKKIKKWSKSASKKATEFSALSDSAAAITELLLSHPERRWELLVGTDSPSWVGMLSMQA